MLSEKELKRLLEDENVDLHEFVNLVESDYIHTQEMLREFVCDMIKQDIFCATLLQSIEDDTSADYFYFDMSGWSNASAKPIYNKEDVFNACLYGL